MILLVEDEKILAQGIADNLRAEGYEVDLAHDGEEALVLWQKQSYALIILDIMMPRRDGLSVCTEIRKKGDRTPVLFLTAKNTTEDRLAGLAEGGDDYLGKPFDLRELLARVRAIVRRSQWLNEAPRLLRIGARQVDVATFEAIDERGRRSVLSQKEVLIVKLLFERLGQVVSRDEILDAIWGTDVFPSSRTIDNFVVRLRRQLEPDPENPRYLHTVRGVGYRLTNDDG